MFTLREIFYNEKVRREWAAAARSKQSWLVFEHLSPPGQGQTGRLSGILHIKALIPGKTWRN
jgi:hypothetical protein